MTVPVPALRVAAAPPAQTAAGPVPLRVSMLGTLQVTAGGRTLDASGFPGSKPRQLLEALLCRRGHRVSKNRLAEELWGDDLPRDHAATLETYVSVLRRTLAPDLPARESVVVTERGGYRIGPVGIEVDLDEFDELVERAACAAPAAGLDLLRSALAIVRGDVLEDAAEASWPARCARPTAVVGCRPSSMRASWRW